MKLYVTRFPQNNTLTRYVELSYDNYTEELTFSSRTAVPPNPPAGHPIYDQVPDFTVPRPEGCETINGIEYYPPLTKTIDIGNLRDNYNWADWSIYGLYTDKEHHELVGPINNFKVTLPNRETLQKYLNDRNLITAFLIYVPYADGTDMCIQVLNSDADNAVVNVSGDLEKIELPAGAGVATVRNGVFPLVNLDYPATMSRDSTVQVTVRLTDVDSVPVNRNATMYLEPVTGSINKTRVEIINGVGTFTVSSQNLNAGDVVRIKMSWKFFHGINDVFITVTE